MRENATSSAPLPRLAPVVRLRAGTPSPAAPFIAAQREAERIDSLMRGCYQKGMAAGECIGTRAGFWRGYLCGAGIGILGGAVLVAGALALGLQVPPLWG